MEGRGGTALLMVGEDGFGPVLRAVLTARLGFQQVIEARALPEAAESLASGPTIGLAVIDLDMAMVSGGSTAGHRSGAPGTAGTRLLRPLRERRPDLRIAVAAHSQHRHDILWALEAGVHGYIPKSFGPGELARAIGAILDGLIFVPPALAEIGAASDVAAGAADADPDAAPHRRRLAIGGPGPAPSSGALTPRQREVLELLVQGKSNKEIARALSLGQGTVKVHISALFRSLGATSRSAAAVSGARLLSL